MREKTPRTGAHNAEDHDGLQETETQATEAEEGEVMSEATRNPTGHGENAAILGVFTSIGLFLGGLVDDPNLSNAIVVGTTIAGKAIFTAINNAMGGTLASKMGAGAMKGAKLGVVLLAMWLPLGCGTTLGQSLGIGDKWTKENCDLLDWVDFAEAYVCSSDDPAVCHHSTAAAYHTGKALCLGLSDDAVTE